MTNDLGLCPGCFLEPRADGPCLRCGYLHDPGTFPSALVPGTVLTKYILGRVLGKPGGFGITYLAFDRVLQRRLAIKELMPRELVARRPDGATLHVHTRDDGETFKYTLASFLKEAQLLAQFSHANMVRVLDYFEANGTAYFAMEYYEGQTLAEYTHRSGGRLSGPEAVSLMLPVLQALEHIHSLPEPILHRDIKPANIYLTGSQTPILLDFGAARVAMGQQSRSLSAVLTPGFAPYEQYSTRGKQGPWSDVYACAATLHFLVTGRVPLDASERHDDPHIESPRTFAPELTPQLSDAIVYGLGFKPEDRPQSARAFADLITGRQVAPLGATERIPKIPAYAPVGLSGVAQMPPTLVAPPRSLGATEIAPAGAVHIPPTVVHQQPKSAAVASPQARRPPNRMPLIAAAAALIVVSATVWATLGPTPEPAPKPVEPIVVTPPPPDPDPEPKPPFTNTIKPVDPGPIDPAPAGTVKPVGVPNPSPGTPLTPVPAAGAVPPPPVQTPPPAPTPVPATGVLVVIRGDDPDGVRQAETAILRSLVGRNGLHALDSGSLSMLTGDQSAVQAAAQGNFAALSSMGRTHGVELMVVGELRSRAVPSINRFFTGTAELSVKMYRVSNSRLVDTQTFIVGQGGSQPVLAISNEEARSRAATQAANAAAEEVGSWLGRAF